MKRRSTWTKAFALASLLSGILTAGYAQSFKEPQKPLNLSGTVTAGYYSTDTRNGHDIQQSSPVVSAAFDLSGYVHSPEFLNFSVKPLAAYGKQSSEAIFADGQGVTASATLGSGGVAPFTVNYSRTNRKLVTFGPLDRLAGLEADTSQDTISANWVLRLHTLPEITLNFARYNDRYEPLQALTSQTENHSRLFSVGAQKKLFGFDLDSQFRLERGNQLMLNIFDPSQTPFWYKRNQKEFRASASRNFNDNFGLNFNGGHNKSDTVLSSQPYDQSYSYLNGSGYYRAGEKLTANVRSSMTTNVVGATLERVVDPKDSFAAQPSLLVPVNGRSRLFTIAGQVQYALTHDLRVDGDLRRESTHTPATSVNGVTLLSPDTTLTSVQAGIGYGHTFRRWNFQSHYAANTGRFDYQNVGPSSSLGHRANIIATIGSLKSVELTAMVQGYVQNIRDHVDVRDRGWTGMVSGSRPLFSHWKLRAGYSYDKNRYVYALDRFNAESQGMTLAISNRRGEISVSRQLRDGLSFQNDPRLTFVSSAPAALLAGALPNVLVLPSTAKWTTATAALHPIARLNVRGTWMQSSQKLRGLNTNDYTDWEVEAGYQFRTLMFDVGYIRHDQSFDLGNFGRSRIFFRVVRNFTVF